MKNKVNEIAISYSGSTKANVLPKITCSQNAADLVYNQWNKKTIELHETFKIMLLNNANRLKGICEVSTGGITGTLVDVRILFAILLKSLTTAVILVHNHPSGTLTPSEADKNLTQKIKNAGALFDITILDHLILTPNGNYYSFADNGIL
ncbi:RadC-like JAB domain-containing protein [Maribacter dokdonensis]|uniref:RadC-like JAB domain-containing protein n=1 Tax=Maribacter dokdonensis TaxID=320912 RepID=A0A1H4UYU8_9FLAO|nr:JAB domain-containing protein [Maribacter dokdonensis]SEC73588.1 RadC-like JAB domain-containing protein [Maribacter dokdonensis]